MLNTKVENKNLTPKEIYSDVYSKSSD